MSLTSFSIILTVLVLHINHSSIFSSKASRRFYYFMTRKVANLINMKSCVKQFEKNKIKKSLIITDKKRDASLRYSTTLSDSIKNHHNKHEFILRKNNRITGDNYMTKIEILCNSCKDLHAKEKLLLKNICQICDILAEDSINDTLHEWKLIALILDRLLFCFFSIFTIISSVFLLFIIPILKNTDVI